MNYASAIIVVINAKTYNIAFLKDGQCFLKDVQQKIYFLKWFCYICTGKLIFKNVVLIDIFEQRNWFIPGNGFDERNEIFMFYTHFSLCILAFLHLLSCMFFKKNHIANIIWSPHFQQIRAIKKLNLISVIRALSKHFR